MKTESCVFFGTGPVAAACLELLANHTAIEAVITKPRPAHYRGTPPVIAAAERLGVPIHTAADKRSLDALVSTNNYTSCYGIVIDFGIIISQQVIDDFELGIINSHFSLLPRLRGADPITWAIALGDAKTGVSLMLIDAGMDTGKLLTQKTLPLAPDETTPSLTDKLIRLSDELIREYIPRYLAGALTPKNQPHPDRATYSRKLTKDDGIIDWSQPAEQIERQIRAFVDWPQSRAQFGELDVIITRAHVVDSQGAPGDMTITGKHLIIGTAQNSLAIDRLKPQGKKEMPVEAFLAGYRAKLGSHRDEI